MSFHVHGTLRALHPQSLAPFFLRPNPIASALSPCRPISILRAATQTSHTALIPGKGASLACASLLKNDVHRSFHGSPHNHIRRPRGGSRADDHAKAARSKVLVSHLQERVIRRIFGTSMSLEDGNELLIQLQKNREDGMPDRDVVYYSDEDVQAGMTYLQQKYPMDEEAAITARIDRELDQEFRLPQTNVEYSPYQTSKYEKMKSAQQREERVLKAKEERERKRTARVEHSPSSRDRRQIAGPTTVTQTSSEEKVPDVPRKFKDLLDPNRKKPEEPEWVKEYRRKATDTAIPSISTRDRLVPAGLFTLAVVLSSLWFADSYIPPSQQARLFPDMPPAAATLVTLATINIGIFLVWRVVPPLWSVMNKYFVTLPLRPRAPQMLLAAFSHQTPGHLLLNIVPFYFIGVHLHDSIGRGPFLSLVFSGAVLSSYTGLVVRVYKNLLFTSMLGLSGVVCATIATACVINAGLTIEFPFLPHQWTSWLNTGVILVCFMGLELFNMRKAGIRGIASLEQRGFAVDNIGHFAGYVTGCVAGILARKTNPRLQQAERESFWYTEKKSPLEHPRGLDVGPASSKAISNISTT